MPKNIYVFLAEGFEETEAIGTIDLLRRAGLPTHIVTIEDVPHVTGAHGIAVQADLSIREVYSADVRALVLPGGLPGVTNLDSSPRLHELIHDAVGDGKLLAAICASRLNYREQSPQQALLSAQATSSQPRAQPIPSTSPLPSSKPLRARQRLMK